MNIDNVVLIRATNNLPINGILEPSCSSKYLHFQNKGNYYYLIQKEMKKYLESQLQRPLDFSEEDNKLLKEFLKDYLPLTSSYTGTLSFSLNGLVPDDINNKFSDMKIAIIDPIKYHLTEDFVNIDVIDTTIKGNFEVSSEAIIVIDRSYFLSLTEEEQNNLAKVYRIELFEGSLKNAVASALEKYNYPSLSLIQDKPSKDIVNCDYKDSMIAFQSAFAKEKGASRLKLQQLYTTPLELLTQGVDMVAAEKVQSDFEKNLIVQKYYQDSFYNFLLQKAEQYYIELDEMEKFYLFSEFSKSEEVLEELVKSLLNKAGVEGYKLLIEEYNKMIQENYLTNDEIVEQKTEEQAR